MAGMGRGAGSRLLSEQNCVVFILFVLFRLSFLVVLVLFFCAITIIIIVIIPPQLHYIIYSIHLAFAGNVLHTDNVKCIIRCNIFV